MARAAVWSGCGFSVEPMPLPHLGPGELLVEVELATICGSDVHTVSGDRETPMPTVLGHEAVGRVVAAGAEAPAAVGDRVVWTIGTSCGECRRCRRGVPQKCEHVRKYGHERLEDSWRLSGALASHVHLTAGTGVVRVPETLPAALLAPAGCATATITAAARRVTASGEDAVVVIGCGMLGLTAVAYARDLGARSVVACDVDPARLDLAHTVGASATCSPEGLADAAREHGADVVLELSGHHRAVASALEIADVDGRVALVGSVSPGPSVAVDPEQLVRRLISVVGSHNYAPCDLVEAVAFLGRTPAAGALTALVSAPHPLDRIEEAFVDALEGRAPRVAVSAGARPSTPRRRRWRGGELQTGSAILRP